MQKMQVLPLGQEDPLEKEMATHSSILAWEIPWTEELPICSSSLLIFCFIGQQLQEPFT